MRALRWAPAGLLLLGFVVTTGAVRDQQRLPLREPLGAAVPRVIHGMASEDIVVSEAEQQVAGMDSYVLRVYGTPEQLESGVTSSVYVGYYETQAQGNTIHSPRNCLPGGGWEPLVSGTHQLPGRTGPVTVNRYLIGNGPQRAMVLYWYQGRGRVASNEYTVKWELLRDQALHRRSDEALVRVIVPVTDTEQQALDQAAEMATVVMRSLEPALPAAT